MRNWAECIGDHVMQSPLGSSPWFRVTLRVRSAEDTTPIPPSAPHLFRSPPSYHGHRAPSRSGRPGPALHVQDHPTCRHAGGTRRRGRVQPFQPFRHDERHSRLRTVRTSGQAGAMAFISSRAGIHSAPASGHQAVHPCVRRVACMPREWRACHVDASGGCPPSPASR